MKHFDVIIIGGSYAGLSAALALGRSKRTVLVIDGGEPCNRFTPHSQNFLTQDGEVPGDIAKQARKDVQKYDTVRFVEGFADTASKTNDGFEVRTLAGETFTSKKLVLAGGLKDVMPDIKGFDNHWGKTAIHCPYCHGYEHAGVPTGVITNGEEGFYYVSMVYNLSKEVTVFTVGPSTFNDEQKAVFQKKNIRVVETIIDSMDQGSLTTKDGTVYPVQAVYHKPKNIQSSSIPQQLGCEINEHGLIKVNDMRETTIKGVFACGDNSAMRSLATAVYTGSMAGVAVNKDLSVEDFM